MEKSKLKTIGIGVILVAGLAGGGVTAFMSMSDEKEIAPSDSNEQEQVVDAQEDTSKEKKEQASKKPSNTEYKSSIPIEYLENENVVTFIKSVEQDINSLAVGFTTMASILEDVSTITTIEDIQLEFSYSEHAYEGIFTSLRSLGTTEEEKEFANLITDKYEKLYNMRKEQVDNLVAENGVTEVNYQTTTKEEVTALWQEIVNMHLDFGTVTGLDYTGGLGALMK